MASTAILSGPSLTVQDYRCELGPQDASFVEIHSGFSVAYVRRGNFGYRCRGRSRAFRRASRGDRRILAERLAADAVG